MAKFDGRVEFYIDAESIEEELSNLLNNSEIKYKDIDWGMVDDSMEEIGQSVVHYFKPWFGDAIYWNDDTLVIENRKYLSEDDICDIFDAFNCEQYDGYGDDDEEEVEFIGDFSMNEDIIIAEPESKERKAYFQAVLNCSTIFLYLTGKGIYEVCEKCY
jgi:hypothetical protein